jgi:hypothetical protein
VLDIGLGGALLLSDVPVAIGTQCVLRSPGDGFTVTADVEVRHLTQNSDVPDYRVGVSFIALRPDAAANLHQFVTGTRGMR